MKISKSQLKAILKEEVDAALEQVYIENPLDLNMPPRMAYTPSVLKARMDQTKAFINSCAEMDNQRAPFPGSFESLEQNRETHEQIEELREQLKALTQQINQMQGEHEGAGQAPPELMALFGEQRELQKKIKKLNIELSTAVHRGIESFKNYGIKCGSVLQGSPEAKLSRLEKHWRHKHKMQWNNYKVQDYLQEDKKMKITRKQLKAILVEEIEKALAEGHGDVGMHDFGAELAKRKLRAVESVYKSWEPSNPEATTEGYKKDLGDALQMRGIHMKEEKDPDAEVRNRGDVVFPAGSSKVKDDKDHFPINSEPQARNALARASQYSSAPSWYEGSLDSLVKAVQRKVKGKYPGIETSEKSAKPGKG